MRRKLLATNVAKSDRAQIRCTNPTRKLRVAKADQCDEAPAAQIDRDFTELAALCELNDPGDEKRLESALKEARAEAKEQMRRQMELG